MDTPSNVRRAARGQFLWRFFIGDKKEGLRVDDKEKNGGQK
jgi:hypothetical protein